VVYNHVAMRETLLRWLAIWAGWTALAIFFAVSASLTYRSTGRPANWLLSFERTLSEWWVWAALTPLVVWLARRYPVDRGPRTRHVLMHLGAGLAIAVAATLSQRALLAWLTGFWIYLLFSTLALQCFVYAAIVAATHGVEYYRRSREREQIEARLADTRLQLLSVQLQPHFLFNTLNTIAEMVHHDAEKADRMITGLSDLLRRALDLEARQEIALEEEMGLLGRYLDIQKTRFDDRLSVTTRIADDVSEAQVPVLLLQPIVENAIRHGMGARATGGSISIEAKRVASRLVITVTDDGPGIADEALSGRQRRGLRNTRERLEALYGTAHALDLTNLPAGGAQIAVEIPFRRGERSA
jgi:two-component system, LytTR family, sensor kinase